MASRPTRPTSEAQLLDCAAALAGRRLVDVAREFDLGDVARGLHAKGSVGAAVERVLGADAGSASRPDFTALGVELKTLPVDERGRPLESTFVCSIRLADAAYAEWATSSARAKLARVLWVPVVLEGGKRSRGLEGARFDRAFLWKPTAEQERALNDDFDEVMGLLGLGEVERVTAHLGRYLQVRPKAAHGGVRALAYDASGERIEANPRGFYLRSRFTQALLGDPAALP